MKDGPGGTRQTGSERRRITHPHLILLPYWAAAAAVSAEQAALTGASDRRKTRPAGARLDEQARFLLDGSREYSLRKHPVLARTAD